MPTKLPARPDHWTATDESLHAIAQLVVQIRPSWSYDLVLVILQSHRSTVDGGDLAIAALRCAQDPSWHEPRAIGFRGPHWRGLRTEPVDHKRHELCDICGKPEPRCLVERPGPDDHAFVPKVRRA